MKTKKAGSGIRGSGFAEEVWTHDSHHLCESRTPSPEPRLHLRRAEHRAGWCVCFSRQRVVLLTAFCLLPTAYCFLAAQQPAPAGGNTNQTFTIRAQTNVVLVDVRVWDKGGNPVTDLKPDDFKVSEDGVRQEISSFSIEKVAQLEAAAAETGPPPTIDLATLPPNTPQEKVLKLLQDRRLMVLFFDQSSMQPDDLIRALNSATHFVDQQMTPADLVAVVTYSSDLRIAQNFTNDRKQLDKILKRIQLGEASSLAEAGSEGDAGGTNTSGQEIVAQDVSAAFTPDETEFNIFNTDEKLGAIESLSQMLRGVPGRKSVIHFSSGLQRTGVDNQAELRAAEDAANQSNVSLYTVDARGLVALPAGGDASSSAPAGTALYSGSAVNSQVTSLLDTRETLASLSADTGGRTFYDLNDFSTAFQRIQEDNSTYYLLGYSPSNTKSDGRFRRIKVEVSRPGVKVQARPGYFAPKNFRQFTREDKEMQLQQAMDLDTPFVDLPMAIGADYFRQADGKYYVVLSSKISGAAIEFLKKSAVHQTEFDFAWRATNQAGATIAALRDTLPVKLSPDTYQQVVAGNILYEGGFVLPPGRYHLKVVARENASGKIGTFEQNLNLPATDQPGLSLSSVVLSNQLRDQTSDNRGRRRPQNSDANPLEAGSNAILPSVTRVFRTSQNLYVYLESYHPKTSAKPEQSPVPVATASVPPSFSLLFFRGGVQISEAGPFIGKADRSREGKVTYFVKLPLAQFPVGRYQMQVNVVVPALDRVAFARVPLAIMRPPTVAAGVAPSGR
jgi:VWFA-related protein